MKYHFLFVYFLFVCFFFICNFYITIGMYRTGLPGHSLRGDRPLVDRRKRRRGKLSLRRTATKGTLLTSSTKTEKIRYSYILWCVQICLLLPEAMLTIPITIIISSLSLWEKYTSYACNRCTIQLIVISIYNILLPMGKT